MTLIAEVKERENIAEYILYMWQMEDLIRGNKLDLDAIIQAIFSQHKPEPELETKYRSWFRDLIAEMKDAGLEKQGHLKKVSDYMENLDELHLALLITFQDSAYIALYNKAYPNIQDLRAKNDDSKDSDVSICLTGLYGYLVLKMRKADISRDTAQAMKEIGKMMAYLSESFKKLQKGDLRLPSQMNN